MLSDCKHANCHANLTNLPIIFFFSGKTRFGKLGHFTQNVRQLVCPFSAKARTYRKKSKMFNWFLQERKRNSDNCPHFRLENSGEVLWTRKAIFLAPGHLAMFGHNFFRVQISSKA